MKPEGLNERGNMVQPQPRQWEVPTRPWSLETLDSTPSLWGLLSILSHRWPRQTPELCLMTSWNGQEPTGVGA